jgi:hypothetical protein
MVSESDQALRINPTYAKALQNQSLAYAHKGVISARWPTARPFPLAEIWPFKDYDPALPPRLCGCGRLWIRIQAVSKRPCLLAFNRSLSLSRRLKDNA